MELRESFDSAPKLYDDGRPSYPDKVVDWIINKTGITEEERLLEIGSGTGQATIKFAERGYSIHCVERGKNLSQLLMQKCEHLNVSVDVSSFEEWKPQNPFKTPFIFCANAFHWIDNTIKFKKCYDLLSSNGYLALLWTVPPDTQPLPFKKAFDLLLEYYPEKRKEQKTKADMENERKLEIVNSGFFTLEDFLDYKWTISGTRDSMTKGFFAQSMYLSLNEEKQKELSAKVVELFRDLDEVIGTDIYTTVYIAKKK
jgi:SAM-dependent methyltransferase